MELRPVTENTPAHLPDWIGETSLTLAEIGAVVCLACLPNAKSDGILKRMEGDEMKAAIDSLKEKGVFSIKLVGTVATIGINLDPVTPAFVNDDEEDEEP